MNNDNFTASYDDFIGIYTNVYPEGFCQHMVDEFKNLKHLGAGHDRRNEAPSHRKKDWAIGYRNGVEKTFYNNADHEDIIFKGLQGCFDEYVAEYGALASANITATSLKMQETEPGGGYHIFHYEHAAGYNAARTLVWALYLNTIDESQGGETEFLYQKRRIRPVENTLLIWPAAYTHTHRGNTVLGDINKYIITGWFNNVE